MSKMDKALSIIIDGADVIVSPAGRQGLMDAILDAGIPAIVCFSMPDKKGLPPADGMESIGGSVYWIANGVLSNG